MKANAAARAGKVRDPSDVAAVNPTRWVPAERASGRDRNGPCHDEDDAGIPRDTFNGQTRWDQGRQFKLPLHEADLADDPSTADQQTSSEMSQTHYWALVNRPGFTGGARDLTTPGSASNISWASSGTCRSRAAPETPGSGVSARSARGPRVGRLARPSCIGHRATGGPGRPAFCLCRSAPNPTSRPPAGEEPLPPAA